jgi:hypothetical protein
VDNENRTSFVIQLHLIKHLEDEVGNEVNNFSHYGTTGTLLFKAVRPGDKLDRIDPELQAKYRSGVRMLIFFIKCPIPYLPNL